MGVAGQGYRHRRMAQHVGSNLRGHPATVGDEYRGLQSQFVFAARGWTELGARLGISGLAGDSVAVAMTAPGRRHDSLGTPPKRRQTTRTNFRALGVLKKRPLPRVRVVGRSVNPSTHRQPSNASKVLGRRRPVHVVDHLQPHRPGWA